MQDVATSPLTRPAHFQDDVHNMDQGLQLRRKEPVKPVSCDCFLEGSDLSSPVHCRTSLVVARFPAASELHSEDRIDRAETSSCVRATARGFAAQQQWQDMRPATQAAA